MAANHPRRRPFQHPGWTAAATEAACSPAVGSLQIPSASTTAITAIIIAIATTTQWGELGHLLLEDEYHQQEVCYLELEWTTTTPAPPIS
jgi:hypothetical protein